MIFPKLLNILEIFLSQPALPDTSLPTSCLELVADAVTEANTHDICRLVSTGFKTSTWSHPIDLQNSRIPVHSELACLVEPCRML